MWVFTTKYDENKAKVNGNGILRMCRLRKKIFSGGRVMFRIEN